MPTLILEEVTGEATQMILEHYRCSGFFVKGCWAETVLHLLLAGF